jgi:hypothetical protein
MVVENKFDIGQVVYLRTDKEQEPCIITCLTVYRDGDVLYEVNRGSHSSRHFDFELSNERNLACLI